jgi:hypothetical protein
VPLVDHELLSLPEYLSSPPFFSGASVDRSSVVCRIHGSVKVFRFNPWKHVFNDVVIRSLDGFVDNRLGYLQISHCGYQDAGNHPLRTAKVIRNVNSHMQFSQNKPVILVVLHVTRKNKAYNYNLLVTSSIL